ncbi:hypothetical protein Tco_1204662 [Tanacetum coccineum]
MVELVKKRRREIREQKLKAKKNKPMTQAEQRNYMMNYVKSQGHGWTISKLKKLSFEELKDQFKGTIKSIENFVPIHSEKEKDSLKRAGEAFQGAKKKKQKVVDVEDIPIHESVKFVKEEEIKMIFDPPQSEDIVWGLPMHIPIVNWRMMLKRKLFDQNTEVKKKLVRSIEKKAGIKA